MKKRLKTVIILLLISLLIIPIQKTIATEEVDAKIILETTDELLPGEEINLTIKLTEMKKNVDTLIGSLEYDKNIFETIVEDDMIPGNGWNYPTYNDKANIFMIDRTNATSKDQVVMNIKLKIKENINQTSTVIKLTDIEIAELGKDLKVNTEVEKTIGEVNVEKLYLSTEIYKIGNNDINNYEEEDKYISRVVRETTKEKFIENLETNGTIRIIKNDGTELGDNELVGTGMTLEVTKDEEKITLQIAVMGDLSGDGKVTITDLSTLNQTILKVITLENEYKLAGDLDENNKITITDYSTLNQIILKLI